MNASDATTPVLRPYLPAIADFTAGRDSPRVARLLVVRAPARDLLLQANHLLVAAIVGPLDRCRPGNA